MFALPPADPAQRRAFAFRSMLLLALVFAVYSPALQGGFLWDDEVLLTKNQYVTQPGGLKDIWFSTKMPDYSVPLTVTSFWVEWRLWGMNPTGYHVTNVFLHGVAALLLWRILFLLKIPGAWLASLLFAVHPVCVASVAWIAERKNALSLVFYLATILYYLKAGDRKQHPTTNTEHPTSKAFISRFTFHVSRDYYLSLFYFLLALLSKSSVVMLPVVLLLCEWWLADRNLTSSSSSFRLRSVSHLKRLAPFFGLSLIAGLVTITLHANRMGDFSGISSGTMLERILGGGAAIWFYLSKILWPASLAMIYPRWEINGASLLWYLPWASLFVVLGICWRFRAGAGKPLLFAIGYFIVTLFPVLGFFDMYYFVFSRVADHLQYLSLIAIVTLVGAALATWLKGIAANLLSTAAVVALAFLTYGQASIYQSPEKLWRDTLAKNPRAWVAHVSLGVVLAERGQTAEAVEHYRAALQLEPRYAATYFNLGNALVQKGELDSAQPHFEKALQLNPNHSGAHNNLGKVLFRQKKWDEAALHFSQSIDIDPAGSNAYANMGELLSAQGKWPEARRYFDEALRIEPRSAFNHFNMGMLFAKQGQIQEAERYLIRTIELDAKFPEAYYNLGIAATSRGDFRSAVAYYEKALGQRPEYADALNNLAWLLATCRDPGIRNGIRAVELAERAVKLSDGKTAAYFGSLDAAYAAVGRFEDAIRTARKTRDLASLAGEPALAEAATHRLGLYQKGEPYQAP